MSDTGKTHNTGYGVWIFGNRAIAHGGCWARAMYGGGEAALCFRTRQEAEASAERDRDEGLDAVARQFNWDAEGKVGG